MEILLPTFNSKPSSLLCTTSKGVVMISKELLSEVLNEHRVILDYEVSICGKELHYGHVDIEEDGFVNIYELAHKCKEWALTNGYHINTLLYDDGATRIYTHGIAIVHYSDEKSNYNEVFSCEADTEPEVVFKACQWILENR